MATVDEVLNIARNELGTKESPSNSNKQKYGVWYGMNGQPWCMIFMQYCFAMAGMPLPYKTASCNYLLTWYKQHKPKSVFTVPKVGDIIIYNFGHTGIVEATGAQTIVAIEGNTSPGTSGSQSNGGMVCRRTRMKSLVTAYIRPDYEEDDDVNFEKWTDADFVKFASKMNEALGKQPVSSALSPELAEAKAKGITDGTKPGAFCTRAQASVMTLRAQKDG